MSNLVQEVNLRLQSDGGRMTTQRRLILQALERLSDHPTAEEIHALVRKSDPSINLSTVYRTLRWLESLELISSHHLDQNKHQDRFDPVSATDHFHFRCEKCGTIIEFNDPAVDDLVASFEARHNCQVKGATLMFYGLCPDCQSKKD